VGDVGVRTPPKILRQLTDTPNFTMLKALIVHIYVYSLLLIRPIISYFFAAKLRV
jgi:hypothetical protein